jgi:hypothetical protein
MSELGEVKGSLALAMSSISPNRTPVGSGPAAQAPDRLRCRPAW